MIKTTTTTNWILHLLVTLECLHLQWLWTVPKLELWSRIKLTNEQMLRGNVFSWNWRNKFYFFILVFFFWILDRGLNSFRNLGHYFSKKGVHRKVMTEPFCCKIIMHTINNHLTSFQYWHCYYSFQLHPPRHFLSMNSHNSPTRLIALVYHLPSLAGRFFLQTLTTPCHRFVSSAALSSLPCMVYVTLRFYVGFIFEWKCDVFLICHCKETLSYNTF